MKKFGKILAMVMVALMMMSTAAFADAAIGEPAIEEEVVTVALSGLTEGEEATILVVNDGAALASLANTDIVYIDQLTVAEDGTVTFTLDASNTVANEEGKQLVDIYCGYTNMDVAAGPMTLADVDINPVTAPDVEYGNVDGAEGVTLADAIIVLQIATGTITDATDAQMTAANVDGGEGVTLADAIYVLQKATGSIDTFPVEE